MTLLKDDELEPRGAASSDGRPIRSEVLVNSLNCREFSLLDGVWQRRVIQLRGHALAAVQHPVQESDRCLLFGLILPLLGNQQVSETRDRVSVLTCRIGNGDPKVEIGRASCRE